MSYGMIGAYPSLRLGWQSYRVNGVGSWLNTNWCRVAFETDNGRVVSNAHG